MKASKVLAMAWVLQAAVVMTFAQPVTLITPTNHTWRYLADGSDQGTAWQAAAFDESAWPQGKGLFGNENNYPYPINTFIPGLTPITVYYRTHFIWIGGVFGITLAGTNYVDDGSIIYLNGVEVARFNMPDGQADFLTLAPFANPGGEPVMVQLRIPLDSLTNGNANPLINGDNVIAVEVHQNSSTSGDRVFGLSLYGGYHDFPCVSDGISPTNRTIFEDRSTTFIVVLDSHCFPRPDLQWYRNVGFGEELIPGATSTNYTLTNAVDGIDEGVYYCRLTSSSGSVDSRQAVLTILPDLNPPSGQRIEFTEVTNHVWRYLTNGTDQGTAWVASQFDDSAWPQGRGLFGNDSSYPYPFNTFIPGPGLGGPLTVYFRTHFTWNGPTHSVVLTGTNFVDDGNVVYLNGVEITRFAMPAGPSAFETLAIFGGSTEPFIIPMTIPLDALANGNANPLVMGDNVLAVEVHQNSAGSGDVVFGLSLYGQQARPPCLDGIQPTNRTVFERRSTTFTVVEQCAVPPASIQWYRDVGLGEEIISGATNASFTLSNTVDNVDDGVYYARLTNRSGSVDSRRAVLVVEHDDVFPQFLSASVVVPGLNKFRLITDEPLCGDESACGSDYANTFNWQILQSDNLSIDLGVETVVQINPPTFEFAATYEFTTSSPRDPAKRYQITVSPVWGQIGDPFGSFVPPGTFAETPLTLTFQQGDDNGYAGTQDAEIHSNANAGTPLGARAQMRMDLDEAGVAQGLLRFDNLFGMGTTRIPYGSRIVSAKLTFYQVDSGSAVNLHRMLVDWNQSTVTWNSLVDGVAANDVEARNAPDATSPERAANGQIELDVTTSVQAWLNGQPNYGWALLSTAADGWIINTSESSTATAPILTVAYQIHGDVCEPAITAQPPASIFAAELQSVIIAVGVTNAFLPVFQWTRNGVDIPGANQPTYVIPSASPLDAGTYRLRMSCETDPSRAVTSNPCVLILTGLSRPYLIGAWAEPDGVTIRLRFSRPMRSASAQTLANYTFDPPLAVLGTALSNASVTLTTEPREAPRNYVLRVANVTDISAGANVIVPNPTFVTMTSARVIVPWNAADWLYSTNNQDATLVTPNIPWFALNFAPGSEWQTGQGLFGYEISPTIVAILPAPIATPLVPNDVAAESELRVTTYFRKAISLPALPEGASYVLCHIIDDGAIFYLDGTEIGRVNMTNTPPTLFRQRAGASIDASLQCLVFSAAPGEHKLAVEVHQAGLTTSSDVLFGVEIRAIGVTPRLDITHAPPGVVRLDWQADSSWELLGANRADGPYSAVAGNPLGTIRLPASTQTNHSFYQLRYTGRP